MRFENLQKDIKRFMIGFSIGAILVIFISQNDRVKFYAFFTLALFATINFVYNEYVASKMIRESEVAIAFGKSLINSINSDRMLLQKCSKSEHDMISYRIQSNLLKLERNNRVTNELSKRVREKTMQTAYGFLIMIWLWVMTGVSSKLI